VGDDRATIGQRRADGGGDFLELRRQIGEQALDARREDLGAAIAPGDEAQQLEGLDIRRPFPDGHDLGVAQQPRRHMVIGVAIAADDLDGAAAGAVGLLAV
jgi:hypothetical protein